MLETDEVDDDYFTPLPNTPLSNIFDISSNDEATSATLKYTPPKNPSSQVPESRFEDVNKKTQCIVACALIAHEWANNEYINRGKVGLAIIKHLDNNNHKIILYNSNKITLSNATVTSNLNVIKKGLNYISYYDDSSRYWSMYGKEEEIQNITESLLQLGVQINPTSVDVNPGPSVTCKEEDDNTIDLVEPDKDSDVSSDAQKTKASIISRMANMGHSVLPVIKNKMEYKVTDSEEQTASEVSSDTSEKLRKTSRLHMRAKPRINKSVIERSRCGLHENLENKLSAISTLDPTMSQCATATNIYTFSSGQLVPVTSTSIITGASNADMNLFMTEQRMSNNEIRININRTTDKVDEVLERVKNLGNLERNSVNFQIEVMQKLITEYEHKIKTYEKIIKDNNAPSNNILSVPLESNEISILKQKLLKSEKANEEKDKEIKRLQGQLNNETLILEISTLKQELILRKNDIENLTKLLEGHKLSDQNKFKMFLNNTLKSTMNDVYKSLVSNFESNDSYSGEHIKSVIASVVKLCTIQSINEYKYDN